MGSLSSESDKVKSVPPTNGSKILSQSGLENFSVFSSWILNSIISNHISGEASRCSATPLFSKNVVKKMTNHSTRLNIFTGLEEWEENIHCLITSVIVYPPVAVLTQLS